MQHTQVKSRQIINLDETFRFCSLTFYCADLDPINNKNTSDSHKNRRIICPSSFWWQHVGDGSKGRPDEAIL